MSCSKCVKRWSARDIQYRGWHDISTQSGYTHEEGIIVKSIGWKGLLSGSYRVKIKQRVPGSPCTIGRRNRIHAMTKSSLYLFLLTHAFGAMTFAPSAIEKYCGAGCDKRESVWFHYQADNFDRLTVSAGRFSSGSNLFLTPVLSK